MSQRTKQGMIAVLRVFNALGIVAIIVLTFLVLAHIQNNQTINHKENAINQNEMICLLKVLPSKRTESFQNDCLQSAIKTANDSAKQ